MKSTAALPSASVKGISREDMSELPIRRYEGSVLVVAGHADVERAMHDILQESVVGFDTETRPAFRPGESYLPSIVQFATAGSVYLLQAQQQDLFGAMRQILSSETIIKAGVSVSDDIRSLKKLFEFDERSVVDLGKVAKRHGLKQRACAISPGFFSVRASPKARRLRTGLRAV